MGFYQREEVLFHCCTFCHDFIGGKLNSLLFLHLEITTSNSVKLQLQQLPGFDTDRYSCCCYPQRSIVTTIKIHFSSWELLVQRQMKYHQQRATEGNTFVQKRVEQLNVEEGALQPCMSLWFSEGVSTSPSLFSAPPAWWRPMPTSTRRTSCTETWSLRTWCWI